MKKLNRFLIFTMCVLLFTGCGKMTGTEEGPFVYYLNKDATSIAAVPVNITGDGPEIKVEEYLAKLEEVPEDVGLRRTIPENVQILSYTLDRKQLYLDFSSEYLNMDKATEVLVRAALVKTMVQVEEVSYVGIRVAGESIKDTKGNLIGLMNENTFLDNMGSEENATKISTLNLYFANKKGDKLKTQNCVVEYNANVAVEKVVVEQLIAGPVESGYYATIPKDTKVMSVTTKDGVCYVNLDSKFVTDSYDLSPEAVIYSIVNSVIENGNVTKVQILIDGASDVVYKKTIDLSRPLEWNATLLEVK